MRMTKKVLAVIMALGMVVCMAAFAFAAKSGTYSLDVARPNDDTVVATLNARDYIGLSSGKVTVNYEGLILDHVSEGVQAKAVNDAKGNKFNALVNDKETGRILYAFTFLEELWTADKFAAASKSDQDLIIDTAMFDLAVFCFKIDENAEEYKISITVDSKNDDVDNPQFKDEWKAVKEPETTTAPAPVETTTCIPCETTTNCCCPGNQPCQETTTCGGTCCCQNTNPPKTDDGGHETGDNSILAVVAGVLVLAGAAVAVTKKRK